MNINSPFTGYKVDPKTGECRKSGDFMKRCKDNEILALDELNQPVCKCKPGKLAEKFEFQIKI